MAYKSKLDRFDMERGDVLSIIREEAVEIAQMGDLAMPVIRALITWFAGNPGDSVPIIKHANADIAVMLNAKLSRLVEHQKQNAARRADFLVKQREKGKQSANARANRDNHGQPRSTIVNQDKDKEEDKDKAEVLLSLSVPDKKSGSANLDLPSGGDDGANAAPAERVEVYWPIPWDEWDVEAPPRPVFAFSKTDFLVDPLGVLMEALEIRQGDAKARNTLAARRREAGEETFKKICWGFLMDWQQASDRYIHDLVAFLKTDAVQKSDDVRGSDLNGADRYLWDRLESAKRNLKGFYDDGQKFLFGRLKPYRSGK